MITSPNAANGVSKVVFHNPWLVSFFFIYFYSEIRLTVEASWKVALNVHICRVIW